MHCLQWAGSLTESNEMMFLLRAMRVPQDMALDWALAA